MPYRGAEVETLLAHSRAAAAVCLAQGKDGSPAEIILSRSRSCRISGTSSRSGSRRPARSRLRRCRETPPDEAACRASPRPTASCCSTPRAPPRRRRACRSTIERFLVNAALSAAELEIDRCVDPAVGRAVHASLRAVLGQPRVHDRRRDRDHAGRSRRRRSRPRSMHAVRPDCSSRRRTCRPASTKAC